MSKTYTHSQYARIMTERELPTNVCQLIDDVSINGSMVVLRKNRPDIHIAPEPEVIPEKEQEQYEEALSESRTLCFRSACEFMQKVVGGRLSSFAKIVQLSICSITNGATESTRCGCTA